MAESKIADLEASTFQKRPCYRYIRASDKVPALYSTDGGEPMALVKLFDPTGSWSWYIAEYDPADRLAYGLVDGFEKEYGYFSMEELVRQRGRFGLPLERDLYWKPQPLKELAS